MSLDATLDRCLLIDKTSLYPDEYPFRLHSYLSTDEDENDYLRAVCESLLLLILPSSYSSTLAMRHLLREIAVFKGTIANEFSRRRLRLFPSVQLSNPR